LLQSVRSLAAGVWDRIMEDGKHTGAPPGCALRNSHYQLQPHETTPQRLIPCGLTNSAALPLFGRLFPLLGRQNSAVRRVAEFASDANGINHLQGQFWPAMGLNRRFWLFFRIEQGNPGRRCRPPALTFRGDTLSPRHH
jgi:hypothetical protein